MQETPIGPIRFAMYATVKAQIQRQWVATLVQAGARRVIVGSGTIGQPGWVATDKDVLNLLEPSSWERYFSKGSVKAILAEHVWEHLSEEDGVRAAEICYMYLRANGYLRVAVPDGLHPDPKYLDAVKPNGWGPGSRDHKVLYDYRTLGEIFKAASFEVQMLEYFDEVGKFHFVEWRPQDGMIWRSCRYCDEAMTLGLDNYTSLILDARKPA